MYYKIIFEDYTRDYKKIFNAQASHIRNFKVLKEDDNGEVRVFFNDKMIFCDLCGCDFEIYIEIEDDDMP